MHLLIFIFVLSSGVVLKLGMIILDAIHSIIHVVRGPICAHVCLCVLGLCFFQVHFHTLQDEFSEHLSAVKSESFKQMNCRVSVSLGKASL